MEELIPRLTRRSKEQARLIRSKQGLKQRMAPELNSLLRWLGGGYVGFSLLPESLRQQATAAAHADKWTPGALGGQGAPSYLRNASLCVVASSHCCARQYTSSH